MSARRPFGSVLIANRGEIAVRIVRSAKALGLRTIAVYSAADADALHVAVADEAVSIGPAPAGESYLNVSRLLDAARASGAEAIHPGYGFLSESADFARACGHAGLVFVGPPAAAIELLSDKARARRHVSAAGVACLPGYEGEDQSAETFLKAADAVGFPVMVKAAAGGGGRGMRLVHGKSDLAPALDLARAEAENAFGNGRLILEKAIVRPRHVEIQIFGDCHGRIIHLGERDCSVQRRHQKIIEEAPCPVMTTELRAAMGAAAITAARSVDYVGAGTVEFLLDEDGAFCFLEMNTRLQVEHPVTELVTGLDLVALQLQVAAGEPLVIAQDEVKLAGHAIEARLYAEDPANDFLPATGRIDLWHAPAGVGVRVDAGIATGAEISPYYDPMIAKIVAFGETRDTARKRLLAALEETVVFGPATNRDFLIEALAAPVFADGHATTAFVQDVCGGKSWQPQAPAAADLAVVAVLHFEARQRAAQDVAIGVPDALLNWTNAAALVTSFDYSTQATAALVEVIAVGRADYQVRVDGEPLAVRVVRVAAPFATLSVDGQGHNAVFQTGDLGLIHLSVAGRTLTLIDQSQSVESGEPTGGGGAVVASMHGLLIDVRVAAGANVRRGETLAIVEAMKMQHEITAPIDGVVATVAGTPGAQIAAGELILQIAEA